MQRIDQASTWLIVEGRIQHPANWPTFDGWRAALLMALARSASEEMKRDGDASSQWLRSHPVVIHFFGED